MIGCISWTTGEGFAIAPARIEASFPNAFRMARYPDGSLQLQGAYAWSQGDEGGVIWKGLPVVEVNEQGQELNR